MESNDPHFTESVVTFLEKNPHWTSANNKLVIIYIGERKDQSYGSSIQEAINKIKMLKGDKKLIQLFTLGDIINKQVTGEFSGSSSKNGNAGYASIFSKIKINL